MPYVRHYNRPHNYQAVEIILKHSINFALGLFLALYSANHYKTVPSSFCEPRLIYLDLFLPLKFQTYITLYAEVQLSYFSLHIKDALIYCHNIIVKTEYNSISRIFPQLQHSYHYFVKHSIY